MAKLKVPITVKFSEEEQEDLFKTCMSYKLRAEERGAENAKLRTLVKDMWPFVKEGSVLTCPSRDCCLFEECDAYSGRECHIEEHMAVRMHAMGIEVDECQ